MFAVKGNREVKILDIEKDKYVENGYKILNDKFKVIAQPSNATVSLTEHNKALAEKDKIIAKLNKKLKEKK